MSLIVALYVVKRRLWLQTVRRHYVAMLLELLCVAAMSKLLLPPSKPETNGHALSARPEAIVYQALEADKQIMPVLAVVYKPRNPVMDDLIMKSFVEGHSPEVTALMKGPEVESKCRSEWTKYGTHGQVACVEFAEVFDVTGGGSLEYELLQASQFEVPERLPLTGPKSFTLDSDDRFKDYFDFMLAEQAKIDSNFLEKAKDSQDVPKVFLRRLPDAPPFIDQEQFRTGVKYITVMVFSIAFLRRVSAITQELESGMKDQQRLSGLRSSAFWLGHFLAAFTIQMVDSTIVIAILYIAGSHGYWKETFFTHTDVSLVIFVMMLFNAGHVLLAMIVAAVCKAGNRATFCAIFVAFFIPSFAFPSEPSSLSGLVFQDRWAKLKSAIAPQYGCSILLRTLAIFDDYEGTGCEWTAGETKLLLDYYQQYFPQIWPMKKFKNKKAMFAKIAANITEAVGVPKIGDQCCSRYKTVMRQKRSAAAHNNKSGNSPCDVPFDDTAKIRWLDDSLESEELRDSPGIVSIKRTPSQASTSQASRSQELTSQGSTCQELTSTTKESEPKKPELSASRMLERNHFFNERSKIQEKKRTERENERRKRHEERQEQKERIRQEKAKQHEEKVKLLSRFLGLDNE